LLIVLILIILVPALTVGVVDLIWS